MLIGEVDASDVLRKFLRDWDAMYVVRTFNFAKDLCDFPSVSRDQRRPKYGNQNGKQYGKQHPLFSPSTRLLSDGRWQMSDTTTAPSTCSGLTNY
eukprot:scaffold25492_cov73-Skeletonema_marinoi.AAC.1